MWAAVIIETVGLELCIENKFRYNEGIYIYSYKDSSVLLRRVVLSYYSNYNYKMGVFKA